MAKGERLSSQIVPPVGIKSKAWNNKKGGGGGVASKHTPGKFSITCPTCGKVQFCGYPGPLVCVNGHRYPKGGYVDVD